MFFAGMLMLHNIIVIMFICSVYIKHSLLCTVTEKMLKHRLYPEEVAKTVIQAIENPKPKLRYIVGKDAEELIELRRKSSDEEFFE